MIYKNVVVKLSKFEKNPDDECLRQSIIYEADRGLWTLEDEKDDLRIFWTKLFLLRMIFAHLGIGKFCDIIENYYPSKKSLDEAERLLELSPLKDLEHRRQMFIAVARARLYQWKGNIPAAEAHLKLARTLAIEGRYAEGKALEKYEQILSCNAGKIDSIPHLREEISEAFTSSDRYPLSSTTERSNSSFSDDQTDMKYATLSDTDDTELKMSVSFETSVLSTTSVSSEHLNISSFSTEESDADLCSLNHSGTTQPVFNDQSIEHLQPGSLRSSLDVTNDASLQTSGNSYPSMEHLRLSSFK